MYKLKKSSSLFGYYGTPTIVKRRTPRLRSLKFLNYRVCKHVIGSKHWY